MTVQSAVVGPSNLLTATNTVVVTNKTFTTPVINGFTGSTAAINIGGGQIYKDTSGKVGIGTTVPGAALDVMSQINVTNSSGWSIPAVKATNFGYSTSYRSIMLGAASGGPTLAIGYDPSVNSNGSFQGDGHEIILRNGVSFMTPNDANTLWNLNTLVMRDGCVSFNKSSVRSGYRADIYEAANNGLNIQAGDAGADVILSLGSAGTADKVTVNAAGDLLVNAGVLGYGTGAGSTAIQPTSKTTTVTLNKPTGTITTSNSALAAGATALFYLNNSTVTAKDIVLMSFYGGGVLVDNYTIRTGTFAGGVRIALTNVTAGSLSDAIDIQFIILKGATS